VLPQKEFNKTTVAYYLKQTLEINSKQ